MNPAALKANLRDMTPGSTLLVNVDAFDTRNLDKAGYESNPLRDNTLAPFRVYEVPMTSITIEATKPLGVKPRDAERSKNFFALGLISWMYNRPTEPLIEWIKTRFANRAEVLEANTAAFRAGYNFGETAELFDHPYEVKPAHLAPGTYRNITGNVALSYGLVAAAQQAKLPDLLRVVPDHSGLRHPPRAVEAEELRGEDAPGRRRDRGRGCGGRRRVRGQPRDHRDERSRCRPQVGGHRPRDQSRAPARVDRRAARRSVNRAADQDRAGRPAARDVRPARRSAVADRRRAVAGRLLRRRVRSRCGSRSSTARR